jgi:CheY-like chemotaxis protein
MLNSLGFNAKAARYGLEALSWLFENREYICALADLDMPYMDGWEFAHRAKELKPCMSIVALAGEDPNDVIPRLDGGGISHTLFKPIRLENVKAVLDCFMQAEAMIGRQQQATTG